MTLTEDVGRSHRKCKTGSSSDPDIHPHIHNDKGVSRCVRCADSYIFSDGGLVGSLRQPRNASHWTPDGSCHKKHVSLPSSAAFFPVARTAKDQRDEKTIRNYHTPRNQWFKCEQHTRRHHKCHSRFDTHDRVHQCQQLRYPKWTESKHVKSI